MRMRAIVSSGLAPLMSTPKCAARDRPSDQSHWHREDQRTWRCHHQDRHGADRIAREPPSGRSQRDRHPEEQERVAVGKPRHWRFRALRLLDQPDDTGICALCRRAGWREVERSPALVEPLITS